MTQMIAYCGLTCSDCPAYLATQADDDAARKRVAAEWREAFEAPNLTAADINCDGCLTQDGRHFGHCQECPIRPCAVERGLVNCAHCADYETCGHLAEFFNMAPEAKTTLNQIRANL
jgi:hypothetical protein